MGRALNNAAVECRVLWIPPITGIGERLVMIERQAEGVRGSSVRSHGSAVQHAGALTSASTKTMWGLELAAAAALQLAVAAAAASSRASPM